MTVTAIKSVFFKLALGGFNFIQTRQSRPHRADAQ
jgi:hypothetical protein